MSNKKRGEICLYIEPYVHINIKKNDILLYNTLNGEQLVRKNNSKIVKLLGRMISKKNLNAVTEETGILKEKGLDQFLKKARRMQLINWYEYSKTNKNHKKPVSLPAILNLHRDREKMISDPERDPGEDIKRYLHKINIYINSYKQSDHNSPLFTRGYKQFLYPYSLEEYNELKINKIQTLLDQVKDLSVFSITILGGNIFQHKEIEDLTGYLGQLPMNKELGVFYRDINSDCLGLIEWEKSINMSARIFVEPQFQKNELLKCMELLQKFNVKSNYQFSIQDENDADRINEMIGLLSGSNFFVKPFFNGRNYNFFRENVFIEKADLSDPVVKKKDIYARSVMNPNSFGHITILSSGDIYSNVNEKRIGKIGQGIQEVLLEELYTGKGWFKVRKKLIPCKSCIYNQICPPISNYEYAFSRNNLCSIHPDNLPKGEIRVS